ncbi:MAG: hypothetical protein K0S24_1982 [Sphingobacterium sp.]|jgi:hypothetical protein|nr:hypothetical protein [Sphingobacterium sp.]
MSFCNEGYYLYNKALNFPVLAYFIDLQKSGMGVVFLLLWTDY